MAEPQPKTAVLTGGVEPDRLGARIEDGKGRHWVRMCPHGGAAPWWLVDADPDADSWAVWSAIPEPTLLVEPGRRTEAEARKCSQPDCPGDGRYQPPGRGHLLGCPHNAVVWVWEPVYPPGLTAGGVS